MNNNFDITIIGGSFAGMSAALCLNKVASDLKIAVIEKQDIISQDRKRDGRAYAISSTSLEAFKEIGILDQITKEAGKISDIKITDYKSSAILDFIGLEVDESEGKFGYIIENYHIHNALRNKVLEQENITLFSPNSYEEIEFEEEVAVKLDDKKLLKSKLLLACDGRFSQLRKIYEIPTRQKKYYQSAIVFNIKHQKPHENIAHEKFLPGGPLALLPMNDPNQSSVVWIAPDELAKTILELDEENFIHQLQKKMEDKLGEVEIVSDRFSYPLIMIEAEKFYHEKMLLVGDAACGVHPIAGQGLNLGIANIKILCDLIKDHLQSGLDIADLQLIINYNKKAKLQSKKMVIATDILNTLFETNSFSIKKARDFGLGLVNRIKPLKKFFIKSAGGF